MNIEVIEIQSSNDMDKAFLIREEVFVQEQQVDRELEYDEFEATSRHFLATIAESADGDPLPAGTARFRRTGHGIKLERFAVLEPFRNAGIGAAILASVLGAVKTMRYAEDQVYLHAQMSAIPFYERYGFEAIGDEFVEADIRHRKMIWAG